MSRIAIVTDSNSGITQTQATQYGITVIPMPFMINDIDYFEDITLTQDDFYIKLHEGEAIKTSQPSPDTIINIWNSLLNDYDEIVHIPMSSGLSGACQTAVMLSSEDEYKGKVFVVNNQRISVTQRQSVLDAIELSKRGLSGKEIADFLENDKFNSSIYIMLDTLYYLKKGGRITPAAAALGAILKLKPVLTIQGEKLDAFAKARTTNQAKSIMITAIRNDIQNRFGNDLSNIHIQIAYTYNKEAALQLKEEVEAAFPDNEIHMDPLSLSVACHIGPGALAVACCKMI